MFLSIVVPVYNPLHIEDKVERFLIPQLDAFVHLTTITGIEWIYVCNGCTAKTRAALDKFKQRMPMSIIWLDEGIGFTKATNIGILQSKGDFVLMFNDDALLLESEKDGWLRWLTRPFFEDASVGLTGVHELFCQHAQENFLLGYCLMARRACLEHVGLLDEAFSPGAGEDTDLCVRARTFGWKVVAVDKVKHIPGHNIMSGAFPIYHPGESSFHSWQAKDDYTPTSEWQRIFDRNSKILCDRKARGLYDEPNITETTPRLPQLKKTLRESITF